VHTPIQHQFGQQAEFTDDIIKTFYKQDVGWLTNNEDATLAERVFWHLEVKRRGSFADTTGCVIMGSVTGAIVSTKISGVRDGHATKMGAHTDHHQPFGILDSLLISLGIAEAGVICASLSLNFVCRPVADEEWLSSPFEGRVLAFRNIIKLNFDLGEGQDISRCRQ